MRSAVNGRGPIDMKRDVGEKSDSVGMTMILKGAEVHSPMLLVFLCRIARKDDPPPPSCIRRGVKDTRLLRRGPNLKARYKTRAEKRYNTENTWLFKTTKL